MKKVLLVDDVTIIRNLLLNIFKSEDQLKDFEVKLSSSAEDAINLIKECDFDVIVLDWKLPEMSGIELAREIKSKGFQTAIIMLTSFNQKAKVKEAFHEGVREYIIKPIVKDDFVKRILKVVNG